MRQQKIIALLAVLAAVALAIIGWSFLQPREHAFIAATADPRATDAAMEVLEDGGTALDAAIAAQAVLTLVEPQSAGLGGGAYLLYWDARARKLTAYDGRETAPAGISPDIFVDMGGNPRPFLDAVVSGESVGVPGIVAMFAMAHKDHGKRPWSSLFTHARDLAENGFTISPRLAALIDWSPGLERMPTAQAYFFRQAEDGSMQPLRAGDELKNPAYAETLRKLAEEGPEVFYTGTIAQEIVRTVRGAPTRAGSLSMSDFRAYRPLKREAVCLPYRAYEVCGMPPSTSGGLTSLQILGILENFDMSAIKPGSADAVHLISEASRLAYADRDKYIADPAFIDVPVKGLLDKTYLAERAKLIDMNQAMGRAPAGTPPEQAGALAPDASLEIPSTTHMSIMDRWGNVVSMTASIEGPFGSHLMAGGFFLNNELTDFSFLPEIDGVPIANAVAPGKRPRSSMTPTMIFNGDGSFYAAIGSPGGSRIIGYVTQSVIALIDWGFDMQSAIDLPRHVNRNGPTEIEKGTALEAIAGELANRGHFVQVEDMTSGLHGIRKTEKGYEGGADPRREGTVLIGHPEQ